ncbi:hypothetical protein [Corynebacterium nuruki]|uniref:hypothetical protein n=1 Tax=Corynebacterium nuruki TaxID=1032851 RepID=UPI0039BEFD89
MRRLPWIPWLPVVLTTVAAVVILVLDPPMRDLQAALARESANRSGVGVSYWFSWFGGVAPGSYSLLVPPLTSAVGSLPLLCLATVLVAALSYPVSRTAAHPTLMMWAVSLAAVLNMFSGRVTFAVGAAVAMVGLWVFQRGRPVVGAVLLVIAGLASALVPAFAGIIALPFLFFRSYRSPALWWALAGAALGVLAPSFLFGAPGVQPYVWTTLAWSLVIGVGATVALWRPAHTRVLPARWIAPVAMAAAVVLFIIPTGVGANLSRFFYLVLPCVVLFWSLRSPKVLALLLSPALVYALFVALYDQVTVADTDEEFRYTPLTEQLDTLVDEGRIDNHRVELVDTGTHAGSHLLTESVPLARGWENQSDMRYNPVFYERDALDATSYGTWLADNAVAYVAVAADPIRQQQDEADLVGAGLPYLTPRWSNPDWTLYEVTDPTTIVPAPLQLVTSSPAEMVVDVPQDAVDRPHQIRIRPNRYLTAVRDDGQATPTATTGATGPTGAAMSTSPTEPPAACIAGGEDTDWATMTFPEAGRYTLTGQFSVSALFDPPVDACP